MHALSQRDLQPKGQGFAVSPSAKLLKPFYWAAAIIAGLIFFYSNNAGTDSLYPLLILPAAIIIWTLMRQLQLRYTKLSVSGGKLRYETGMMSRSVRTMEVSKVQDVRVDQSFMDRLLNLGTIAIETAGEASGLTMAGVEDPQEVADSILEAARK
jgi:uncharacterized membrane protein YdbT with pleckstrin-like domain